MTPTFQPTIDPTFILEITVPSHKPTSSAINTTYVISLSITFLFELNQNSSHILSRFVNDTIFDLLHALNANVYKHCISFPANDLSIDHNVTSITMTIHLCDRSVQQQLANHLNNSFAANLVAEINQISIVRVRRNQIQVTVHSTVITAIDEMEYLSTTPDPNEIDSVFPKQNQFHETPGLLTLFIGVGALVFALNAVFCGFCACKANYEKGVQHRLQIQHINQPPHRDLDRHRNPVSGSPVGPEAPRRSLSRINIGHKAEDQKQNEFPKYSFLASNSQIVAVPVDAILDAFSEEDNANGANGNDVQAVSLDDDFQVMNGITLDEEGADLQSPTVEGCGSDNEEEDMYANLSDAASVKDVC